MSGLKVLSTLMLFGLVLASTSPSHAQVAVQNVEDIVDLDLETLLNLDVVTASKVKQKQREAPSIISVVTREQFDKYGWFTINDALYSQPGFFPSQDYDRRVVGSRGLFEGWNNNHLLHLVDGVPFNDPMYGTAYTWDNTPIFMLKRMEVIRGPGSALYGTNATNGVISIETLSGSDMKGRAEGSVRFGSSQTNEISAWTGNVQGNFNYFMGFSSQATDGHEYYSFDNSGRTSGGLPATFKTRDDHGARYFLFKIEGENELKGLSFQYHDQSWKFKTGHGWLFMIPDYPSAMHEHRRLATASYRTQHSSSHSSEFTLKFERKEIDWNTRYAPDGTDAGTGAAPNGIWEYANFFHDNYFARAQSKLDLGSGSTFLAGVEGSAFVYDGDESHFSNTDLAGGTYAPNPGGGMTQAPSILGIIENKPLLNVGAYTQYISGDLVSSKLPITLGLRYDTQKLRFHNERTNTGGTGEGSKTFNQWSPRIGIVYLHDEKYSMKLLASRAFRAPAPSELAGFGTWALANNLENLKPETVSTVELASDWRPTEKTIWKTTFFYTKAEDQIGYSGTTNLSTNIYTTTTAGVESELNYAFDRMSQGFLNVSYSKRLDEEAADGSVTPSTKDVTWAPYLTANFGANRDFTEKLKGSLYARYMGEVKRKASDRGANHTLTNRSENVNAWVDLNAGVHYTVIRDGELSLFVRNLLDKEGFLIKPRDNTFDYEREGRSYYVRYTQSF